MAITNVYLSMVRGKFNLAGVTAGAVSQNTSADIELRMQTNNGSNATGLTRDDVIQAIRTMEQYFLSNGIPGGAPGTNLPAS